MSATPQATTAPRDAANPQECSYQEPMAQASAAALMAAEEDWAVFRRFDEQNLLNLLMMQEEIQQLTKEFRELTSDNNNTNGSGMAEAGPLWYISPLSPRDATTTQARSEEKTGKMRREVWGRLREKLREYNCALLEMAQLRSVEPPDPDQVKRLREELARETAQSRLARESMECWSPAYDDDLVVLRSGAGKGSRSLATPANEDARVIVVGKKKPHISKAEMAKKHASASRFVMALFGGFALILPTVVMVKTGGVNFSLIITSVAVILFSLVVAFGARDATGKDVLAATAAYTAVLVVFVGTRLQGSGEGEATTGSNTTAGG